MNILVTGSNGQLGSELQELSRSISDHSFFFYDLPELDITDSEAVMSAVAECRPSVIINAAAYTAVDKAERDPESAFRVNRNGAGVLAAACRDAGALLLHVSTDYVFDGSQPRPYRESDPPSPSSVYGRSKFQGEGLIGEIDPSHIIVRTSWLYSSHGSNFVKTMLRLGAEKKELQVVFDQTGTPTSAVDLAGALMEIAWRHDPSHHYRQTYHYSNEGTASWYDFAYAVMELSGLECSVHPVDSSSYPQEAPRPSYSVLDKGAIKRDWGIRIPYWRHSLATMLSHQP
ncbi:MAG: dTDP-4-dehydrorhamnose reductase [Chlorobium sp.]|nr:dTDP-4-dehydrorhamnose reductase [Chlorobium phaeovibrioides]NQU45588.1 dTDP-4-dehydrorhamnose reductase [Chlorobium sp.]